jgi:hypothetical protein
VGTLVGGAVALPLGSAVGTLAGDVVGACDGVSCGAGETGVGSRAGVAGVCAPDPPGRTSTVPRLVPVASDPPTTAASGRPRRPSTPVSTPSVATSTAAAATEIRTHGNGRGGGGAGAFGSGTGATAATSVRRVVVVRRTTELLRRNEDVYIAVPTVAITLATAAPTIVPATPRKDAPNAADDAASALPATWEGLRPRRGSSASCLFGRDMGQLSDRERGSVMERIPTQNGFTPAT